MASKPHNSDSKETIRTRLELLLSERKLSIVEASRRARVPASFLHNILAGHNPTNFNALSQICEVLGTDMTYVLTGKVPNRKNKPLSMSQLFKTDTLLFDGVCRVRLEKLSARDGLQGFDTEEQFFEETQDSSEDEEKEEVAGEK